MAVTQEFLTRYECLSLQVCFGVVINEHGEARKLEMYGGGGVAGMSGWRKEAGRGGVNEKNKQ